MKNATPSETLSTRVGLQPTSSDLRPTSQLPEYWKTVELLLDKEGLSPNRMLGSKTIYLDAHPEHIVLFNANLLSRKEGCKVWHGDLDLTVDGYKLRKVARELDDTFYVLREMDCRFGEQLKPFHELAPKAVWNSSTS